MTTRPLTNKANFQVLYQQIWNIHDFCTAQSAPSLIQNTSSSSQSPRVTPPPQAGYVLPQQAKLDKAVQSKLPMPLSIKSEDDDLVLAEFNAELEMTLLSLLM